MASMKAGVHAVMASHRAGYASTQPPEVDDGRKRCHRGVECTDFKPEHRDPKIAGSMSHPVGIALACSYGRKCFRKNLDHLKEYVHPGDRNYRVGMVHFGTFRGKPVPPDFLTVRDLFNYCDPDESGNISPEEFQQAWGFMKQLPKDVFTATNDHRGLDGTFEEAWTAATRGQDCTHITFAQFAAWSNAVGLELPVGVDIGEGAAKPCRFEYSDSSHGGRCVCQGFKPVSGGNMCECGHKGSCHHSDAAMFTVDQQRVLTQLAKAGPGGLRKMGSMVVKASRPGFDMVTNKDQLADLQKLLDKTVKHQDNWTRDRGCAIHGRNKCEAHCIFGNRAPVPKGYELIRAEKNRNDDLWQTYSVQRAAIREECATTTAVTCDLHSTFSCVDIKDTEPLDPSINEWRLYHGTGLAGIKGICGSNFKLKMAGCGATWKKEGEKAGTPLYGWGVYLAEHSTKSDEYAEEITKGLPIDVGCYALLVCRVVGGLTRLVDTNEFDTDQLRQDIFDGPYHSVFGDRVCKLGKPYREIVVYDNSQIFPEYILYYKRKF